ncbi:MAG: hypothetical protein L0L69_10550 [Propionibacterium sp.]|nr:hypothetical protein [Propionibacterium sp.]
MPTPDWASSGVRLIVFLFFVVLFRAQGTYWLGRLAAAGSLAAGTHMKAPEERGPVGRVMARMVDWFNGPTPRKGAALLERWGLVIIPLCFLTVGIQTAVNAGSGVVRLKWRTYTLAMIPGCIAWALMYGLGMLAVWQAVLAAIAGSPWAWAAFAGVAALFVGLRWWRRHGESGVSSRVEAALEDGSPAPTSASATAAEQA